MDLEEAIGILIEHTPKITRTEEVGLLDAVGRVLATDIVATMDNPPFPKSPLDGYTFNSMGTVGATKERPAVFTIVGEECAGEYFKRALQPGEALRLMTGARIPEGADCVVRQEDVVTSGDKLEVFSELKAFDNYCPIGEDYTKGTLLIPKDTYLKGTHIGVLASLGLEKVLVYQKPLVVLASTGDELVTPGEKLQPGQIYNSNEYTLAARLRELGVEAQVLRHLPDDATKVANLLKAYQGRADLIITTGGVSVGKKDIMHEVLPLMAATKLFWKISLKPGSPVLCYTLGGTVGVALSGNPFAALTTFELMVRPVLAKLTGNEGLLPKKHKVVAESEFTKGKAGRRMLRAVVRGHKVFLPDNHKNGSLATAAGCNALLDVPEGHGSVKIGDKLTAWLLD